MTDRSSRHADLPTYRRAVAGAPADTELYTPRLRTRPDAVVRHAVTGADRLDLLAYRYLDDPHQFWLIADANPDSDLDALIEPGRTLGIPRRPA
ncbi:hypothetical protein [Cryptosporangium minutisporangium]|uniref:hypothetical protein n=1 Tax=Cryptosporangium minutisporangium TaxID=113569 RepID=UPI0035EA4B82